MIREDVLDEDLFECRRQNDPAAAREIVRLGNSVRENADLHRGTFLLQLCLEIIFYLSMKEESRDATVEAGGCELCSAIMLDHPERLNIGKAGVAAVANLAYCSVRAKTKLGDAGACEAVVAALLRFPQERHVQMHGCMAIRNLALDHVTNTKRLREARAREAISAAMWGHQSSASSSSSSSAGASRSGATTGPKSVQHWAKLALKAVPQSSASLMSLVVRDAMAKFQELKEQALAEERAGDTEGRCLI